MTGIANKDEALKCLQIAQKAQQAGDADKAARFVQKALKLHDSPEIQSQAAQVLQGSSPGPSSHGHGSAGAPNGHSSHTPNAGRHGAHDGPSSSAGGASKDHRPAPEGGSAAARRTAAGVIAACAAAGGRVAYSIVHL